MNSIRISRRQANAPRTHSPLEVLRVFLKLGLSSFGAGAPDLAMLHEPRRGLFALVLSLCVAFPMPGWADKGDEVPLDQIVVTATRMTGLIRDEPLRVEAVPADEIEENLTVQPGNLSSLLNELPGVRVQSDAPGLGGAGLQLRGMPTRHTLVLTDGLPLLGTEPDSFGLLQTPPLDLARVEVIKGAASALYGGSALGGVLNLVSQTAAADSSVLANVSSRGSR
ncbi:MAG TPA: Plug domain-containing protein, partial [Steroidobacteraceae bacterium]|nr:Plug domain-containing protein [Steroidobacteraceae bacterium]